MYYRKCANGCLQPRLEQASQAEYGYGADIDSASSISASAGTSSLTSGAPLYSIPLPDTRPPVQAVSTTDPTGSATPGGGHRTTAESNARSQAFGFPAFGTSGARWGGELCEAVPSPAMWNDDGGKVSSLGAFLGLTVGGLLLAAVFHDMRRG